MNQQNSSSPNNNDYPDIPITVKDLPPEMRPREEFWSRGAGHVGDETLLAILLRAGIPGKNVTDLARELLRRYKGLEGVAELGYTELLGAKIKGLGKIKCTELAAAFEIARRITRRQLDKQVRVDEPAVRDPESAYHILAPLADGLEQEVFWVVLLNTKKRMIGQPVVTSIGLLDSSPVHPREVFKEAIRSNAASVILAHNHPSGDPTPSREDLAVTRRLIEVANLIGISVVDHIIIGRATTTSPGYMSLRASRLVTF